ncbi:putative phase-variable hemagglutinin [Mycoplasmopsis synoviae 53]|uniref:Putative phase-variable hemagglutinin n=1 Tax=Mycoplasmopsis synoviae (strain 53) TaxID=262723 RepID=Q4A6H8_MYCS5|nr:putative phase-variable hemagglutinin [Mycoplasmopsis synoviae 53]
MLYWDGFMPRIVIERFDTTWTENTRNRNDLVAWFQNTANWSQVSEQLTKKLGVEKLRNVNLVYKNITWVNSPAGAQHKIPTVTFTVEARDGYTLADDSTRELSLVVRNLYNSSAVDATTLFPYQGASSSAVPSGSSVDDANVKANVNVYLNYTGSSIVLYEALPTVGGKENTSLNGTSNITDDFNNKFNKLLIRYKAETSLLQAIINYVNKFDPKFRAQFVTKTNGVALTSVQNGTQLKIGSLNDFLWNNKGFLQQVNGDSSAAYFAVNGVTSQGWLNTFLIRIPLNKFVKAIL